MPDSSEKVCDISRPLGVADSDGNNERYNMHHEWNVIDSSKMMNNKNYSAKYIFYCVWCLKTQLKEVGTIAGNPYP